MILKNSNKKLLVILFCALGIRIFISCYDFLFQTFFVDDAFYYFTIARNIASGAGITYDGVQRANGVQPLFLFLISPFFLTWKNSTTLPLHLVAFFLSLVSLGIGILLFKISRTIVDEWYALFIVAIWSLSPIVVDKELNGMETGLNLFLILATLYYYSSWCVHHLSDLKSQKILTLGVLLGLVILSRLDGIFLLGVIVTHLSYCIIKESRKTGWCKELPRCIVPLTGVVLIFVLPWLVFNYSVSESIIPTSGQAVRFMSQNYGLAFIGLRFGAHQSTSFLHELPIKYYFENIFFSLMKILLHLPYTSYLTRTFYDFLHAHKGDILLSKGIIRILASLGILGIFSLIWMGSPRTNCAWKILFFYSILLMGAYSFYAFGQWFYHRYYFATALMGTLWGGNFLRSIDVRLYKRSIRQKLFKVLIVIIFAILYLLEWRAVFLNHHKNQNLNLYKMVKVVEQKIPEGSVIGCFQSGIVGYYSNRRIINLDGVVNQEALLAMKGNRLGEYVRRKGITYIMDWPYVLKTLFFRHLGECNSIQEISLIHKGFFYIYRITYNRSHIESDK